MHHPNSSCCNDSREACLLTQPRSATLNVSLGAFLGLRVLYTALYINTTDNSTSRLRSVTWLVSTLLLFSVYVKAGNKMLAA
jgi:uncharacterized MAPEG superfamily protein